MNAKTVAPVYAKARGPAVDPNTTKKTYGARVEVARFTTKNAIDVAVFHLDGTRKRTYLNFDAAPALTFAVQIADEVEQAIVEDPSLCDDETLAQAALDLRDWAESILERVATLNKKKSHG